MDIYYNSQDKACKAPFGAVPCCIEVNFSVKSDDAEKMFLYGFENVCEMTKKNNLFTTTITAPSKPQIMNYYFKAVNKDKELFIIPATGVGGQSELSAQPDKKYQLTVYNNSPTPKWFKGAVMYQIYVDRFFRPANNNPPLKENILFHSSWNDTPNIYLRQR